MAISHKLLPDGPKKFKITVQKLEDKILRLAEDIHQRINNVSNAILARHEFWTSLSNFTTWIDQMDTNTKSTKFQTIWSNKR